MMTKISFVFMVTIFARNCNRHFFEMKVRSIAQKLQKKCDER